MRHCWLESPVPEIVYCCMIVPLVVDPLVSWSARPLLALIRLKYPPPASTRVHTWSRAASSAEPTICAPLEVDAPATPKGFPLVWLTIRNDSPAAGVAVAAAPGVPLSGNWRLVSP